jgi:hypothetical protein
MAASIKALFSSENGDLPTAAVIVVHQVSGFYREDLPGISQ